MVVYLHRKRVYLRKNARKKKEFVFKVLVLLISLKVFNTVYSSRRKQIASGRKEINSRDTPVRVV